MTEKRKTAVVERGVEVAANSRARVRVHLIEPLVLWGIKRPARMKVADYEAMLVRLSDGLAYMSDDNLRGLRELVARHVTGKPEVEWPAEITVRKWASRLQAKPYDQNKYVQSLMRSAMGRKARDLGYHVDLFILAMRLGPPPTRYDLTNLTKRAGEGSRERMRMRARIENGTGTVSDQKDLEWFAAREAECLSIMDDQTMDADA